MTPLDWDHSLSSSETGWWLERAFTAEALADVVSGLIPVLSVRTGSDFHGKGWTRSYTQLYTRVLIPSTFTDWRNASWTIRRQHVTSGLSAGSTIASHRGGWGRVAVNGVMPGGVLRNIPANTDINFQIRFIPAKTGLYMLRVFRNNLIPPLYSPVYEETLFVTAGKEITRTFTRHFPGGNQGYWFYVSGLGDTIYSTPVIVSSQP
ncbi:hypothetical protein M1O19_06250 [Dehalococcoidia bacterium]|nr:hypothetical protein [Dehalococcoidia bacterium]